MNAKGSPLASVVRVSTCIAPRVVASSRNRPAAASAITSRPLASKMESQRTPPRVVHELRCAAHRAAQAELDDAAVVEARPHDAIGIDGQIFGALQHSEAEPFRSFQGLVGGDGAFERRRRRRRPGGGVDG